MEENRETVKASGWKSSQKNEKRTRWGEVGRNKGVVDVESERCWREEVDVGEKGEVRCGHKRDGKT